MGNEVPHTNNVISDTDTTGDGLIVSHVRLFATPWTVAHKAPQSMEFSRQEYWSGLPFPSPGDLPDPGINPGSPALSHQGSPSDTPEGH